MAKEANFPPLIDLMNGAGYVARSALNYIDVDHRDVRVAHAKDPKDGWLPVDVYFHEIASKNGLVVLLSKDKGDKRGGIFLVNPDNVENVSTKGPDTEIRFLDGSSLSLGGPEPFPPTPEKFEFIKSAKPERKTYEVLSFTDRGGQRHSYKIDDIARITGTTSTAQLIYFKNGEHERVEIPLKAYSKVAKQWQEALSGTTAVEYKR